MYKESHQNTQDNLAFKLVYIRNAVKMVDGCCCHLHSTAEQHDRVVTKHKQST